MSAADVYDRVALGLSREVNERMLVGQLLEAPVLDLVRHLRGLRLKACHIGYAHPTLPLCASPDAYVLGESALCEVKVTGAWAEDQPRYVFWQVQTQLLLTGREHAYVAVLNGSRLNLHDVPADEQAQALVLAAVQDFDERHLAPRSRPTPPELTFSDRSRRP